MTNLCALPVLYTVCHVRVPSACPFPHLLYTYYVHVQNDNRLCHVINRSAVGSTLDQLNAANTANL